MNIFLNIYNNWTVYEWVLTGGLLLLIFLLTNLATYIFTKNWTFNKLISITYAISSIFYIASIFVLNFFIEDIGYIFIIPIFLIYLFITINWLSFIGYYKANSNKKTFSLVKLLTEFKKDSIRNIVILTISILAVSIFLRGDLLYIFIITYIGSSISIYMCSILASKFIHD
jgi:hypothetical protein